VKISQAAGGTRSHQGYRGGDFLGAVSFGVFIIIVAVIWLSNPKFPFQIIDYFRSFETYGRPVLPPPNLLSLIGDFAVAFGTWLIILGALRIVFQLYAWRSIGDMVGGIFFIYVSHLISDFVQNRKDVAMIFPLVIIGLGVAVIVGEVGQILASHYTSPQTS
jgi:hypothetical protein